MDHCRAGMVHDHCNLERSSVSGGTDVHGHLGVVGGERRPVVAEGMEHVGVGDAVAAGAGFDLHEPTLRMDCDIVSIC